jgi:hypothetical protein
MVSWWKDFCPGADVLVVYGGPAEAFADLSGLGVGEAVLVRDERLRTSDHQRERQSFHGVFRAIRRWVAEHPGYRTVLFTEFDCVPLRRDLLHLLEERMRREHADVLGCGVERIDGTNHPHFLYHESDVRFRELVERVSVRSGREVALAMLGCVSYWRREAFEAVASVEEASSFYLEVIIPTLAHHLGYRVRNLADQSAFVRPALRPPGEPEDLVRGGAWMVHPWKDFWGRIG